MREQIKNISQILNIEVLPYLNDRPSPVKTEPPETMDKEVQMSTDHVQEFMGILANEISQIAEMEETHESSIAITILDSLYNICNLVQLPDFDQAMEKCINLCQKFSDYERSEGEEEGLNESTFGNQDFQMQELKEKIAEANQKINCHIQGASFYGSDVLPAQIDQVQALTQKVKLLESENQLLETEL